MDRVENRRRNRGRAWLHTGRDCLAAVGQVLLDRAASERTCYCRSLFANPQSHVRLPGRNVDRPGCRAPHVLAARSCRRVVRGAEQAGTAGGGGAQGKVRTSLSRLSKADLVLIE